MAAPLLVTKLRAPVVRPGLVARPRLIRRLEEGLAAGRALSLVSAPAGFGKTTLVGEWVAGRGGDVAWLSLDEGDSEPARFLLYLAAALERVAPGRFPDAMAALASSASPSLEAVLDGLINELDGIDREILLVLDDYHRVGSPRVDALLSLLLENLPPRLRIALATREDPGLPLARLRARDCLTELRAADLRFNPDECAEFLGRATGLDLGPAEVAALGGRTEGWIAGLRLAALSLRGKDDPSPFIRDFSASHRHALDYLAEEVFRRQAGEVRDFLLRTSILERLCAPLCDALLPGNGTGTPGQGAGGRETLEYLDRANLFLEPLDEDRVWYRYHGLFGELLRQRLGRALAAGALAGTKDLAELHSRASAWFEAEGWPLEAFRHAAAAGDVDRAERLATSGSMPVHFPGAVSTILDWLATRPAPLLDARPSLRVLFATMSLVAGRTEGVEESLAAAERSLGGDAREGEARDLAGRVAVARATLALVRYDPEAIVAQASRALELLAPDNLPFRSSATWTLAIARSLTGDRAGARRDFDGALALCRLSGDVFSTRLALSGSAGLLERDTELREAAARYRRAIALFADGSSPDAAEAHLGLGRVLREWNDLDAAEEEGERALALARLYDGSLDRFVPCELFLAAIQLDRGLAGTAAGRLDALAATARARGFLHRLGEVAGLRLRIHLRSGEVEAAARLAESHGLAEGRARVLLARGLPAEAASLLEARLEEVRSKHWRDEELTSLILLSLALDAAGRAGEALGAVREALALAEGGGYTRLFLDEGKPMAALLAAAAPGGKGGAYALSLLGVFAEEGKRLGATATEPEAGKPSPERLSPREAEVLRLVAEGLSNQEIGERLYLALDTVKGHNRRIFDKLAVKRRTEAIARARELGLL